MYIYVLPMLITRLLLLAYSRSMANIELRYFLASALAGVLAATWVIVCLNAYDKFSPFCYDPYPSISLVFTAVFFIFVIPEAFITICFATLLLVFSPCIILSIVQECQRRGEEERTQ